MITARDVADYFLSLVDEEYGDSISNLKLQKLLYYAQGYFLAAKDRPLFYEEFEAWEHGPVIPDIYNSFKQHGAEPLPLQRVDTDKFTADEVEHLNDMWEMFGQFSATKLRNMSHQEPPYTSTPKRHVIGRDSMKQYFKTQIVT